MVNELRNYYTYIQIIIYYLRFNRVSDDLVFIFGRCRGSALGASKNIGHGPENHRTKKKKDWGSLIV